MKPEIWYDWDNNKNQSVFENNFYNLHAPDIKEDTTMDANMKKRNELLAKTVIKGLESRNMSGYYAKDKEAAVAALANAISTIDKAATKGVYHKNNAARKVSRLSKAVNTLN